LSNQRVIDRHRGLQTLPALQNLWAIHLQASGRT
jgi:hypothetical protein